MADRTGPSDFKIVVAGAIIGAWIAGVAAAALMSIFDFNHEIGADHGVCMTIVSDDTRRYRACATGSELLDYLRHREGIK